MKKYFAKYLPIEGDIKENNLVLMRTGHGEHVVKATKEQADFWNTILPKQSVVKLFLCSHDIDFGDEIVWSGIEKNNEFVFGDKWKYEFPVPLHKDWVKVIGEISKEAVWVKEGDEFNQEEIRYYFIDYMFHRDWSEISKAHYDGLKDPSVWNIGIKIKSAHCKHFH